ncbi:terpene synthase family protein [Streptomyces sp.]|uniref:terpene synthase family protein n=1 Tax=Streptomyces sp. TaxID=1931 RepID=UPI002F42A36E
MTTVNEPIPFAGPFAGAGQLAEKPVGTAPAVATEDSPLSSIYCPVIAAIHPQAGELNEATLAWVRDRGLIADPARLRHLERQAPGLLAARVVPRADMERLLAFADFHTWLFAFDDEYCDEDSPSALPPGAWMAFLARMLRQAETPTRTVLKGNAYADALHDIATRLDRWCTGEQKARWTAALRTYFAALVWERQTRLDGEHGVRQSLDDYVLLRLQNGAMHSSIALLDATEGYVLPAEQRERPEVRALIEMTATLVSWDNDIFSWSKERERGSAAEQNLLDVLATDAPAVPSGTGHEEALRQAVALRNGVMDMFLRVSEGITPTANPELLRFIASLGQWVRANLDFSLTTARYVDPSRSVNPAAWEQRRDATHTANPLAFEALSWWGAL